MSVCVCEDEVKLQFSGSFKVEGQKALMCESLNSLQPPLECSC